MLHYIWASFLSAFLIFQIQPIVGRYILPWFGGTPAVWSAVLLFFQVILLAGYGYAYWLLSSLRPQRQARVHLSVLGLVMLLFLSAWFTRPSAIVPRVVSVSAAAAIPIRSLLSMLLTAVGLPYFALATTSPLVQAWYCRSSAGRTPYPLYAYSNAGSLLALVSYPFLVEPALSLRHQAATWSAGFVLFALSMGYIASRCAYGEPSEPVENAHEQTSLRSGISTHAMWLALSTCASVLLLATTRQISQEVAVVPFLWILPLVLYLLSFVLCFSNGRWYSRGWYSLALFLSTGVFCWIMIQDFALGIVAQIGSYSLVFFVCCMICHGELFRTKPHPRLLASFYLTISAGGAFGGVFVTLIAPRIFAGYWELQVGLLLCWILLLVAAFWNPPPAHRQPPFVTVALLVAGIAFTCFYFFVYINVISRGTLAVCRNFYGILRVRETGEDNPWGRARALLHGAAIHGFQFQDPERLRVPTAYYTVDSGVGLTIMNHPRRGTGLRIGVLGLGIGTLAAYGRPEDTYRLYEINPDVIRLAEGWRGFFTFVRDSRASIQIVPGDARISLASELERGIRQDFDLLVMDTFNSDSVPVHLLTKEAFEIYLAHMRSDGMFAVHITNKHLDLRPVVFALADHFGLAAAVIRNDRHEDANLPSLWVIATRNTEFFKYPVIEPRIDRERGDAIEMWTDDYSNLFQILK